MARKIKPLATQSAVAEGLGVHRSTVSRRMKKLGMKNKKIGKRAMALTRSDRSRIKSIKGQRAR